MSEDPLRVDEGQCRKQQMAAPLLGRDSKGVRAPYWHLCRDHVGIVVRAPIPPARKMVLLSQLARTMASRARPVGSWPSSGATDIVGRLST